MEKIKQKYRKIIQNFKSIKTIDLKSKETKNKLKNLLKIFIISLIIFLISYYLYKFSLRGCMKTEYECLTEKKIKFFYKLGVACLISTIFFVILLKYLLNKKKKILLLIYTYIYLNQAFSNKGENTEQHGRMNMLGFFFFFTVIYSGVKIYDIFYKQIKKRKYRKAKIYLIIFLAFSYFYIIAHRAACNHFYDGLGGKSLINNRSEDACYIGKPRTCDIPIWGKISLFDYSRFIFSCKNRGNSKSEFINFLNSMNPNLTVTNNTYYFPNTNIFSFHESNLGIMNKNVFKNITGTKIPGTHDQIWISFDEKDNGHINIDIPYNKTLVEEKRKKAKNTKVKYDNVYTIYIDSLSRAHFIRKLKKTSKLIDHLIKNRYIKHFDDDYSLYDINKNLDAFQFFKYQSFDYNTPPNYGPIFFGRSAFSMEQNKSIVEHFSNKGYITSTSINGCAREAFNIVERFYHMNFYPSDYEGSAIFCDPNYWVLSDKYSIYAGMNAKMRRCFYEKDTADYLFEYTLKFLETYKNERKFFRLLSNDAHEGTGEVVKYIDNSLHNFLLEIFTKYFDDRTLIIFLSDHGASLAGGYELMLSEDKDFEKGLGFLFVFTPKKSPYKKILEHNEQKLVTPYDIFGTFIDVLFTIKDRPSFYFNGQSLLTKINGLKRSCNTYSELRGARFCRCFDF